MGTYLSTPVTEKHEESGEALHCPISPVAWGVVEMQGWRKSMEDAHVAQTDVELPDFHLQGEFDTSGLGLETNDDEQNENHIVDEADNPAADPPMIDPVYDSREEEQLMTKTKLTRKVHAKIFGVFDGHGGPEVARFCQLYLVSVLTQQPTWLAKGNHQLEGENGETSTTSVANNNNSNNNDPSKTDVGKALVMAFHAMDRMIDDPERRDELIHLRAIKPEPGERKIAENIPPLNPDKGQSWNKGKNVVAKHDETPPPPPPPTEESNDAQNSNKDNNNDSDNENENGQEDQTSSETSSDTQQSEQETAETQPESKDSEEKTIEGIAAVVISDVAESDSSGNDKSDDDSDEAVGKEEAAEMDQDLMDDAADDAENEASDNKEAEPAQKPQSTGNKVSVMFHRLLKMSGGGGVEKGTITVEGDTAATAADEPPPPQPSLPTMVQNGRLVCNLPDHPIHAGATAIVAVIVGRTLTVANAGDSRAVLCRDGIAYALSYDHKPMQDREMNRIQKAGGFVNQFGRVNGNLNLSRSIGDLKYKSVQDIGPQEQMITAQPDIVQMKLEPQDEFIILGCDGIWDCLSNEKAVEFVRTRIGSMTATEIGVEMLDKIISVDPRVTAGIGGDNMTIMIVDLQPHSRSYRLKMKQQQQQQEASTTATTQQQKGEKQPTAEGANDATTAAS